MSINGRVAPSLRSLHMSLAATVQGREGVIVIGGVGAGGMVLNDTW